MDIRVVCRSQGWQFRLTEADEVVCEFHGGDARRLSAAEACTIFEAHFRTVDVLRAGLLKMESRLPPVEAPVPRLRKPPGKKVAKAAATGDRLRA